MTEEEKEAREVLARLIWDRDHLDRAVPLDTKQIADAILAAGYRKLGPVGEREAKITGDLVTMRVVEWRRITDELSRLRTMEGAMGASDPEGGAVTERLAKYNTLVYPMNRHWADGKPVIVYASSAQGAINRAVDIVWTGRAEHARVKIVSVEDVDPRMTPKEEQ